MPISELNPYDVGRMRLKEVNIHADNFTVFEVIYIGECSIERRKVVLGRIGNQWAISGRPIDPLRYVHAKFATEPRFRAYYIIKGRNVTTVHKSCGVGFNEAVKAFKEPRPAKHISQMTTAEIFNECQGVACPKHQGRGNRHSDIGRYK